MTGLLRRKYPGNSNGSEEDPKKSFPPPENLLQNEMNTLSFSSTDEETLKNQKGKKLPGETELQGEFHPNVQNDSSKITFHQVHRLAICSAIILFCVQLLASEISLHPLERNSSDGQQLLDPVVDQLFRGFIRPEGQQWLGIIANGYRNPCDLEFYPLFPAMVAGVSSILSDLLFPLLTFERITVLVSFLTNFYFAVKSAQIQYSIAMYWDRSGELRALSVLLFCFNPASFHFLAVRPDSLYFFLSSHVLLAVFRRRKGEALLYAGLSAICRPVGVLNHGFCLVPVLEQILRISGEKKDRSFGAGWIDCIAQHAGFAGFECFTATLALFPFLLFQLFAHTRFPGNSSSGHLSICESPNAAVSINNGRIFGSLKEGIPYVCLAAPALVTVGKGFYDALQIQLRNFRKTNRLEGLVEIAACVHGFAVIFLCIFFAPFKDSVRIIFSVCPYVYILIAQTIYKELNLFRSHTRSLLAYSLWIFLVFIYE